MEAKNHDSPLLEGTKAEKESKFSSSSGNLKPSSHTRAEEKAPSLDRIPRTISNGDITHLVNGEDSDDSRNDDKESPEQGAKSVLPDKISEMSISKTNSKSLLSVKKDSSPNKGGGGKGAKDVSPDYSPAVSGKSGAGSSPYSSTYSSPATSGKFLPPLSTDSSLQTVAKGLDIVSMSMWDANLPQVILWTSTKFHKHEQVYDIEFDETIPAQILQCSSVCRELIFSSRREINKFSIKQRVLLNNKCIERWSFDFGYVIAGSTNSWQQIIEAAPQASMMPPQVLSGNVIFETHFYDGNAFLCKNRVRLFYEE